MTEELPPVARLLWSGQRLAGRGPKPALTLDRIVGAAVEVADADGIGALSMQRVAKHLGAATMSLYRHVPSKDDLISLMFDAVMGDPPPLRSDGWRAALERWARAIRQLYLRHPWMLAVGTGNRFMGPNEAGWAEAAGRALLDGGLPAAVVTEALLSVSAFTGGVTRLEIDPGLGRDAAGHTGPTLDPAVFAEFDGPQRFPSLAAVSGAEDGRGAHAAGTVFEFGLAALLDGIAERLAGGLDTGR
ncbi:TetR/AcrR family transcriptional regulator [Nocardia asiatica]|uniref:TetR/AcrR family transcriptional regulator n=1 Tax=Nocardia asiatica TaxID=209252 RepID=UPI003EE1065C